MYERFTDACHDAIREADRNAEMESLTGEPASESPNYKGPHNELLAVLDYMREQVIEHRDHEHMWDEDCGICLVCGMDGNA